MHRDRLEIYIISTFYFNFGLNMISYRCHLLNKVRWVSPAEFSLKRLNLRAQACLRLAAPRVIKFTFVV